MIFYPTIKAWERYSNNLNITNDTPSTRDPTVARDMILAERIGISIEGLKHLMDDDWCREHQASVCEILGIYGDKTDLRIDGPDDR